MAKITLEAYLEISIHGESNWSNCLLFILTTLELVNQLTHTTSSTPSLDAIFFSLSHGGMPIVCKNKKHLNAICLTFQISAVTVVPQSKRAQLSVQPLCQVYCRLVKVANTTEG